MKTWKTTLNPLGVKKSKVKGTLFQREPRRPLPLFNSLTCGFRFQTCFYVTHAHHLALKGLINYLRLCFIIREHLVSD